MVEVTRAPLPERIDFLASLLDDLRETIDERNRSGPYRLDDPTHRIANFGRICRAIAGEVGPETVLIRGDSAYVPTGLASYRAMPFRDLDVERIAIPDAWFPPGRGEFVASPEAGLASAALRTVPEAILGPLRVRLETAELHPSSALAGLPELQAGLVCRLALLGLQWIRGPNAA